MKLLKSVIDSLEYKHTDATKTPAPCIYWDDELKGVGVRINPKGTKTFVLSYRVNGRKRILKLGRVGTISLDDARKRARKALGCAVDGIDFLGSKVEEARGKSVTQLCDDYIERHAKIHKRTWQRDVQRLDKNVTPAIGTRLVSSITSADIAKIHHEMTVRGAEYEANRTIEVLRKMFKLAKTWGYFSGSNPVENIVRNREEKRDVFVSHEHMPKLAEAIDAEKNVYIRTALWLFLYTGMRKAELLSAQWNFIDWKNKEIRLPVTKNGKPHYIPLSGQAIKLLKKLPQKLDNPYIFPGEGDQPRKCIKKDWERVRVAAEMPNLRIHDLRRTCGSWLAQSGHSLPLIGKILNHSSPATTQVYARFAENNVRKALETHGKQMLRLVVSKPTNKFTSEKKSA